MYCPSCRSEYIEGVKMCKECDVALVDELPPEPKLEYLEQVTVFSSASPSLVAMAQSILESAGIESYMKDANLANLLDIALVELQVAHENEEDARKLLEDLKETEETEEEDSAEADEDAEGEDSDEDEEEYDEEEEAEDDEEIEEVEVVEVVDEETKVTEDATSAEQPEAKPGAEAAAEIKPETDTKAEEEKK